MENIQTAMAKSKNQMKWEKCEPDERQRWGRDGETENEEMEVKGQEEGGEGSSDPSQTVFWSVCVCITVYTCVSVCVLSSVYTVCGLFMYVCLISHVQ